jgi:hypothetical protein
MKKSILLAGAMLLFLNYAISQNRITVQTGQKVHSINNSISTITQNAMGQEIEIKSNVTVSLDAEVKESSPNIHLDAKIARLQVKSEAMGNVTDFDSDKKEDKDGQVGQLLSTVVGKSFDLFISSNGKPIKDTKPLDPSTEAAKSMMGNFDDLSYELMMPVPSSLKSGDIWTEEIKEDAENIKKIEYKVISISTSEVVLQFKGSSISKMSKSVQGMDAVVTSNSTFSGEVSVDGKSGIIKKKKTDTESKGTTQVMGQSIPFTIKQTIASTNE